MFDWNNISKDDQKQKDYAKPFIGGYIDSKCPTREGFSEGER